MILLTSSCRLFAANFFDFVDKISVKYIFYLIGIDSLLYQSLASCMFSFALHVN